MCQTDPRLTSPLSNTILDILPRTIDSPVRQRHVSRDFTSSKSRDVDHLFYSFYNGIPLRERCRRRCVQGRPSCLLPSAHPSSGLVSLLRSFDYLLAYHGIWRDLTCPQNPQQNGVAKWKNKVLMEATRAMLNEKYLPDYYWAEVVEASLECRVLLPIHQNLVDISKDTVELAPC